MSSPQRSRTSSPGSRDEPFMSPASPSAEAAGPTAVDPLVAETARKIAHVINDLKRDLDTRDGTAAEATGAVKLVVDGTTFELSIVPSEDGVEHPITVQTTRKESGDTIEQQPNSSYKTTRRASDAELAGDIVSRNKRKLEDNQDEPSKRSRIEDDDDDEDIMPLITTEDLSDLLTTLREDIQDDTSECVNHVQRLLRRFREEWQESSQWKTERSQSKQIERSLQDTVPANGSTPGVSFPSPSADREDPDSSTTDVLRREAKLISTQIKWVEDCRRVAADIQGKKEEIWRTSSAGFHDRQRQDREAFQHRMLHESGLHTHTLNQILNEVKAIGLYAQSMKWETPTSHLIYPSPSIPTPPAFPTQPAPPTPAPKPAVRARPAQQPPPPPPAPPQHPNQV